MLKFLSGQTRPGSDPEHRRSPGFLDLATRVCGFWPGLAVCVLAALSASFISSEHGGPALLYALLIGMSLNFLNAHPAIGAGVSLCGKTALRIGVALLGARITVEQVAGMGASAATVIAVALFATILVGLLLARLLGQPRDHGLVAGCSVAICGASAALAVSAVLPPSRENERFTLLTVVGVTILSTVAMVLYPVALRWADVPQQAAGVFIGGTIHDVAQVVAAGTLMSPRAADAAVVTKLYRVALLAPVVMLIAFAVRRQHSGEVARPPLLPLFMVFFIALVVAGSLGWIPHEVSEGASSASRWMLLVAIAAAGIKTPLQELARLGWRPAAMLLAETIFLAGFVGIGLVVKVQ